MPADTPAKAAARAWLHSYGINTARYTDGAGDHPAMRSLSLAFEAFARRTVDAPSPELNDEVADHDQRDHDNRRAHG